MLDGCSISKKIVYERINKREESGLGYFSNQTTAKKYGQSSSNQCQGDNLVLACFEGERPWDSRISSVLASRS